MVKLFTQSVDQNLAAIVRHDLPKVISQRKKFETFKKFSQLSDEKAREALRPGSGPVLCVSELRHGVYGQYRAGDEIHINSVIVYQHQAIVDAWLNASLYSRRDDDRWIALVKKATLILESSSIST